MRGVTGSRLEVCAHRVVLPYCIFPGLDLDSLVQNISISYSIFKPRASHSCPVPAFHEASTVRGAPVPGSIPLMRRIGRFSGGRFSLCGESVDSPVDFPYPHPHTHRENRRPRRIGRFSLRVCGRLGANYSHLIRQRNKNDGPSRSMAFAQEILYDPYTPPPPPAPVD